MNVDSSVSLLEVFVIAYLGHFILYGLQTLLESAFEEWSPFSMGTQMHLHDGVSIEIILRRSTDPRDKVYAVRGILHKLGLKPSNPESRKHPPELYRDFFVNISKSKCSETFHSMPMGHYVKEGLHRCRIWNIHITHG